MMIITGGIYKGRKILAPDKNITRPTLSKVRMGVFNTLFSLLGSFENKSFLDLFGGSGIMGIEAISRGFSDVLVFEKNPKACAVIKKNYAALGLTPNLKIGDSLKLIRLCNKSYDVIYVDPPYQSNIYEEVFDLIKNSSLIIAEHSNPLTIPNHSPLKIKNYGGKMISFYGN